MRQKFGYENVDAFFLERCVWDNETRSDSVIIPI